MLESPEDYQIHNLRQGASTSLTSTDKRCSFVVGTAAQFASRLFGCKIKHLCYVHLTLSS